MYPGGLAIPRGFRAGEDILCFGLGLFSCGLLMAQLIFAQMNDESPVVNALCFVQTHCQNLFPFKLCHSEQPGRCQLKKG
jgi:hypothetical protein